MRVPLAVAFVSSAGDLIRRTVRGWVLDAACFCRSQQGPESRSEGVGGRSVLIFAPSSWVSPLFSRELSK